MSKFDIEITLTSTVCRTSEPDFEKISEYKWLHTIKAHEDILFSKDVLSKICLRLCWEV
jgi:hypothetical protein